MSEARQANLMKPMRIAPTRDPDAVANYQEYAFLRYCLAYQVRIDRLLRSHSATLGRIEPCERPPRASSGINRSGRSRGQRVCH